MAMLDHPHIVRLYGKLNYHFLNDDHYQSQYSYETQTFTLSFLPPLQVYV